ncbi:MAG TPA: toxin [Candidatus Paceibacterota bacterium]
MAIRKHIDWDPAKNIWLKKVRYICFDDILPVLQEEGYDAILPHPNQKRYPNQKIYVLTFANYVYLVPFVEDEDKIFLKTIFPSRKANKIYSSKNIKK